MSSSNIKEKLKNIAKRNIKKVPKSNKTTPPDVEIKRTRDGKGIEVSVQYYFELTKKEIATLNTPAAETNITTVIDKIIQKKLLLLADKSEQVTVTLEQKLGKNIKIPITRTNFEKIMFNPDNNMLQCTTKKKIININEALSDSSIKKIKTETILRKDSEIVNKPSIKPPKSEYSVKLDTTLNKEGPTKESSSDMKRKVKIKNSQISYDISSSHAIDLPMENNGSSIQYPTVGEVHLEYSNGKCFGYFVVNKERIFLDKHANKSLMISGDSNYQIEAYRTRLGRSTDTLEIENLQELTSLSINKGLMFYKFEHQIEDGEYEYFIKLKQRDPSMTMIIELLTEISRLSSLIQSAPSTFHTNSTNVEQLSVLYDNVRKTLGQRPIFTKQQKTLSTMYLEELRPTELTFEILEFLINSEQIIKRQNTISRNDDGTLRVNRNSLMEKVFKISKAVKIENNTRNIFNSKHTPEQVLNIISKNKSTKMPKKPFTVKYSRTSSARNSSENESYFLDKENKITEKVNTTQKYKIEVSILKKYETSYKHNVPLLKSPSWLPFEPEEVKNPTLARAIVFCDDGTQYEEYFIIGN